MKNKSEKIHGKTGVISHKILSMCQTFFIIMMISQVTQSQNTREDVPGAICAI